MPGGFFWFGVLLERGPSFRWDTVFRKEVFSSERWNLFPIFLSALFITTSMKRGYIYILTNKSNGTLYIGVTSNLARRIYEHRQGIVSGFSKKYNLKRLIYYEIFDDIHDARKRELNMKAWNRDWKIELIEKFNPEWRDLYEELL